MILGLDPKPKNYQRTKKYIILLTLEKTAPHNIPVNQLFLFSPKQLRH